MAGILILTLLILLFGGLWFVVTKTAKFFKLKRPSIYGCIALLALYLYFSNDWIPAKIYYWQQCKIIKANPVQVYITPEAWAKEIKENKALYQDPSRWKIQSDLEIPDMSDEGYTLFRSSWDDNRYMPFVDVLYEKNGKVKRITHQEWQYIDRVTGKIIFSSKGLGFDERGMVNTVFFPPSRYCQRVFLSSLSEYYNRINSYNNALSLFINKGE